MDFINNIEICCANTSSQSILTAKEELCSYLMKKLPSFINIYKIQLGAANGLPKQEDLQKIKNHAKIYR